MRPKCQISVPGGTAHLLPMTQLAALQARVGLLGADAYPLFLRLGSNPELVFQPVVARALLAEVERFTGLLADDPIPALCFADAAGQELGRMYSMGGDEPQIAGDRLTITATADGIRMQVELFPPPVGFRSRPGLRAGWYECYFTELCCEGDSWYGRRTPAMAGTGAPVAVPAIPVPPATHWDDARVAGRPAVAAITLIQVPAAETFRDVLHALTSACEESIRLKAPVRFRRD
jgi:hypothetical protein